MYQTRIWRTWLPEALLLPSMLWEINPLSFLGPGNLLDQVLQMQDDGSLTFLFQTGQRHSGLGNSYPHTDPALQHYGDDLRWDKAGHSAGAGLRSCAECILRLPRSVIPPGWTAMRIIHYSSVLILCSNFAWSNFCCTFGRKSSVLSGAITAGIIYIPELRRRCATVSELLTDKAAK